MSPLEKWISLRSPWHTPYVRGFSKSQSKKPRIEPIRPYRTPISEERKLLLACKILRSRKPAPTKRDL